MFKDVQGDPACVDQLLILEMFEFTVFSVPTIFQVFSPNLFPGNEFHWYKSARFSFTLILQFDRCVIDVAIKTEKNVKIEDWQDRGE